MLFSALIFFFGKEAAVANSFSIISVGFLPDDRIEIKYDYEGGNIVDVQVMYVPDLTNPVNIDVPEDSVEFEDDNVIIISGFEPDVWTFILFAQFDDNSFVGSDYHSTIFLKDIESSSIGCGVAVNALWTNYTIYTSIAPPAPPVPVPFDHSEFWMSKYNTETERCTGFEYKMFEEPISFADSEIIIPLDGGFFDLDDSYCFWVRSISETDSNLYAKSNYRKDVLISDIIHPQHIEIISVDVDNDAENISVVGSSEDPDVSDFVFELYRSNDGITFFDDPVQQLLGAEINPVQFSFVDDVNVDEGPYYYSIKSVNKECEIYFFEAEDIVPSIFLETSLTVVGTDLQIIFEWNYDDSFDSYQNARLEINGQETPINLGDEVYTETLSIEELGTLITSWIQAEDMEGNTVRSNRTELRIDILDRENIPNAFRPESDFTDNQKFIIPFIVDASVLSYNMKIYDKNGQLVFRSDPDVITTWAWNGQVMNTGPEAPAGSYVYELEYAIPGSPPETKRGVVYLIR